MDNESDNIPGYLAKKYERLYNAVDDEFNIAELEKQLARDIKQDDYEVINKVTPDVLMQSAKKLKPGKIRPSLQCHLRLHYPFTTHCIWGIGTVLEKLSGTWSCYQFPDDINFDSDDKG